MIPVLRCRAGPLMVSQIPGRDAELPLASSEVSGELTWTEVQFSERGCNVASLLLISIEEQCPDSCDITPSSRILMRLLSEVCTR